MDSLTQTCEKCGNLIYESGASQTMQIFLVVVGFVFGFLLGYLKAYRRK